MTGLGAHYRRSRERLTALLGDVDEAGWQAPVAACPGWRVHDVVGHLVGIVEDAMAGRMTVIPPPAEQTNEQVERHRDDPPELLLATWTEAAGPFEPVITQLEAWPAAIDAHSHEHDVRAALARPGARDDELVLVAARLMIEMLEVDGTISVDLGDGTDPVSSTPRPGPDYLLRATPFEVFRLRTGRRSRDQVTALDWSRDPGPVLDALFLFGPAEAPLVE
jgi:uncharacterized protein (TIGR03083 family)